MYGIYYRNDYDYYSRKVYRELNVSFSSKEEENKENEDIEAWKYASREQDCFFMSPSLPSEQYEFLVDNEVIVSGERPQLNLNKVKNDLLALSVVLQDFSHLNIDAYLLMWAQEKVKGIQSQEEKQHLRLSNDSIGKIWQFLQILQLQQDEIVCINNLIKDNPLQEDDNHFTPFLLKAEVNGKPKVELFSSTDSGLKSLRLLFPIKRKVLIKGSSLALKL